MEFGFSRFLEMFEERFGRTVTTIVLGLVGAAVALYCAKVVIEAAVYFYGLMLSMNFLAALRQETVAAHAIIFVAQIILTSLVLQYIWRQLYLRYVASAEAEITALLERAENEIAAFEQKVQAFEGREDKLRLRMDALKARQEEILTKMGKKR